MQEHAYSKVKVLVAQRHPLLGSVLMRALCRHRGFDVVSHASDTRQVLLDARRMLPDVVVVDRDLPDEGGIAAARRLKETVPACNVVVITEDDDCGGLLQAVRAGIKVFVTKRGPLADLIEAVHAAHNGEALVPRVMIGELLDRLVHGNLLQDPLRIRVDRLSRQERVVLGLLIDGASNQVIADALTISPKTARTHVQNILKKLEVHSRLEAVALATSLGVVDITQGTDRPTALSAAVASP